jgi:hypothetical protein
VLVLCYDSSQPFKLTGMQDTACGMHVREVIVNQSRDHIVSVCVDDLHDEERDDDLEPRADPFVQIHC